MNAASVIVFAVIGALAISMISADEYEQTIATAASYPSYNYGATYQQMPTYSMGHGGYTGYGKGHGGYTGYGKRSGGVTVVRTPQYVPYPVPSPLGLGGAGAGGLGGFGGSSGGLGGLLGDGNGLFILFGLLFYVLINTQGLLGTLG